MRGGLSFGSRASAIAAVAVVAAGLPAGAAASQLVDRSASGVRLSVSKRGTAVLAYRAGGQFRHVLVWGALNARQPTREAPQVRFHLDYSGGWGVYHRAVWRQTRNTCRAYDGPSLPWLVTACTAADGTYWAVQSWQRMLPNHGAVPRLPSQSVWELRISHWSGPVAQLQAWGDWIRGGAYHVLFGRLTYQGAPVHGFRATRTGAPLDSYGRNLYLDTYNSAYGGGWRRENSFLAHNPNGVFCYGFYGSPSGRPARGNGERYRITVIGPGVTPDVMWTGPGLPDFNPHNPAHVAHEQQLHSLFDEIAAGDRLC